jgi:molybdopterin-guanine dinucleotide biosynthesis protein MobB
MNTAIIGFAAYSGTGKTTLIEQLIPMLREQNIRLAVIKHAHHKFDIDKPGKDSFRFRHAGANQVLVASAQRWALMQDHENPKQDPDLFELLDALDHDNLDLIIVEGFKHINFPKIEINREACKQPFMFTEDSSIIALCCDHQTTPDTSLPCLNLADLDAIIQFLINYKDSHEH